MDFENKLKALGLSLHESDAPDRDQIDFTIMDAEDDVCWVHGDAHGVSIDCDHPYESIEWVDDDECGICHLCGAECTWHWEHEEEYEGTDENGDVESTKLDYREPDEWSERQGEGLIGEYLNARAL